MVFAVITISAQELSFSVSRNEGALWLATALAGQAEVCSDRIGVQLTSRELDYGAFDDTVRLSFVSDITNMLVSIPRSVLRVRLLTTHLPRLARLSGDNGLGTVLEVHLSEPDLSASRANIVAGMAAVRQNLG